jgi:O-methyltransferase
MLKRLVPRDLRKLRVRILWFIRHFSEIRHDTGIFNEELHGPVTYRADGLITSSNADFISSPRFKSAYAAAEATRPWPDFRQQWRVYIVCWMAEHAALLDGDYVECGVNTGAYAAAIVEYLKFDRTRDKVFYLMDTFAGLDESLVTDAEKKAGITSYIGAYKDVYEQVKETFAPHQNVQLIRGRIPDTLSLCKAERVCFLSIDMNCVAPEIAAAEYFWEKIVPGGVIVLDDYGFPAHIHQKLAFDAFAATRGVNILALPTGQGIIFKP